MTAPPKKPVDNTNNNKPTDPPAPPPKEPEKPTPAPKETEPKEIEPTKGGETPNGGDFQVENFNFNFLGEPDGGENGVASLFLNIIQLIGGLALLYSLELV